MWKGLVGNKKRLHLRPSFSICKSEKCKRLATKYVNKLVNDSDASNASDDASDTSEDASHSSQVQVSSVSICINCFRRACGAGSDHLNCSACHEGCSCSTECQNEDWSNHKKECKKACKRATCHHCGKLETIEKFSRCTSCKEFIYCEEDEHRSLTG
jgi:hypothetical protein